MKCTYFTGRMEPRISAGGEDEDGSTSRIRATEVGKHRQAMQSGLCWCRGGNSDVQSAEAAVCPHCKHQIFPTLKAKEQPTNFLRNFHLKWKYTLSGCRCPRLALPIFCESQLAVHFSSTAAWKFFFLTAIFEPSKLKPNKPRKAQSQKKRELLFLSLDVPGCTL